MDTKEAKDQVDSLPGVISTTELPDLVDQIPYWGRNRAAVFLMGTTIGEKDWREGFAEALNEEGAIAINPRVSDWDPDKHPKLEALAREVSSVNVINILKGEEGQGDTGLGSLAEIGIAAYDAITNGKVLLVSIEDGYADTLQSAKAKAEYNVVVSLLKKIHDLRPDQIKFYEGNTNPEEFKQDIVKAVRRQKGVGEMPPILPFEKRQDMLKNTKNWNVVIGGTSKASPEEKNDLFQAQLARIKEMFTNKGHQVNLLSSERNPRYNRWEKAYVQNNFEEIEGLFTEELEDKEGANVLVLLVDSDADGMAASAELLLLATHGLLTGQMVCVLSEPYSANEKAQMLGYASLTEAVQKSQSEPAAKELSKVANVRALVNEHILSLKKQQDARQQEPFIILSTDQDEFEARLQELLDSYQKSQPPNPGSF